MMKIPMPMLAEFLREDNSKVSPPHDWEHVTYISARLMRGIFPSQCGSQVAMCERCGTYGSLASSSPSPSRKPVTPSPTPIVFIQSRFECDMKDALILSAMSSASIILSMSTLRLVLETTYSSAAQQAAF